MADTFEGELDLISFPQTTIIQLKAYPLTQDVLTRKDGSLIFCVDTQKLYQWNSTSTATPDDIDIILSDHSATGRWLATGEYVKNVVHKEGNETINGSKIFTGHAIFEKDVTIQDDLGVTDRCGVGRLSVGGSPNITTVLLGTQPGATNDKIITSDYFLEHPTSTATIINTNNSGSDNYFAGLVINSDGQTAFTISQEPYTLKNTIFLLNGQMRNYGVDYTILGTALTWLDPVEGGVPKTLKTTDELIVIIGYSLSGATANYNENGLIIGGYWNGANWISNNSNINILIDIPDNSLPDATGRISVAHGIAAGTPITSTDLKVINYFEQEQAARAIYGYGSGTIELTPPNILTISTTGTIVTARFDRIMSDLKSVGDKIEIVDTTNYDGTYVITEVPTSPGTQVKFAKAGAFAPEATGYARLEYSPQPQHNQHGIFVPSSQHIRIIERIATLADGFYMDIRKGDTADGISILPEGAVELKGQLLNGTAKTWTSGSAQFPYIERHETVRLRKQKDNIWWLEFVRVAEA